MGISFGSINTGLPKDIVQQIIKAERIPVEQLQNRRGKIEEKHALLKELTGLVDAIRGDALLNANERSLREFKIISNEELINVDVDKNIVEPGSYQFEVMELAKKSSAMSSGFEDPDDSYVGVGFIQYYLPNGDTNDVYIDEDNASLNGIAKLINKDSNNGMRALVVDDGTGSEAPWRLVLTLESTGDKNDADFPYFYFVDGEDDMYLEFERHAHDSMVKLDGFELEVETNTANELIPGVSIDLKKASPGEEFTIQIVEDVAAIGDKINGIVEKINAVFEFIRVQNSMDENTDSSRTLGGDITLQTVESRIRSLIFSAVPTSKGNSRIGDLGITFQRNGQLKFDQNKFEVATKNDLKFAMEVLIGRFTEDGEKIDGFINKLDKLAKGLLLRPNGVLSSRDIGIKSKIDQIDRQIESKQRTIETKEKNLKAKFARLEGTISRIKNQGAGLAALQGGQGFNPVPQLG